MEPFDADIPTMDMDTLTLLPECGGDAMADVEREMDAPMMPHLAGDESYQTDGVDRECRDATQARTAAEAIRDLPGPRQGVHLAISGRFALFDTIPAILQLAAPAVITDLTIATLGFSRNNVTALADTPS